MKGKQMEMKINRELDPVFETMGLLHKSVQGDIKDQLVTKLGELGTDGERFYKKYYKFIEEYEAHFEKHMEKTPAMDFFFRKDDEQFFLLIAAMLTENRQWLTSMEKVTDEEVRGFAVYLLQDKEGVLPPPGQAELPRLETERERMEFLAEQDLEEGMKWHLMEFLQHPARRMKELTELVNSNIPAFEKAFSEMESAVKPFIEQYQQCKDEKFREIADICASEICIYPAFAAGTAQIIFYSRAYYGIFTDFLLKRRDSLDERKTLLLTRMKALSDRSKLDILCQLKASSKYNLELAQSMNLSASTMSHHMNVLFACDLVGIEKRDGRVYYFLREDAVRECLEDLEDLLL